MNTKKLEELMQRPLTPEESFRLEDSRTEREELSKNWPLPDNFDSGEVVEQEKGFPETEGIAIIETGVKSPIGKIQEQRERFITDIVRLRVNIDSIFNSMITNLYHCEESKDAIKEAKLAKAWLGMILKSLERTNPYPESMNFTNTIVEKTADTGILENIPEKMGVINAFKFYRNLVQEQVDCFEALYEIYEDQFGNCVGEAKNTLTHLVNSKTWLGLAMSEYDKIEKAR